VVPKKGAITIAIPSGAGNTRPWLHAKEGGPPCLAGISTACAPVPGLSAASPHPGSVVKALGSLKGAAGIDFSKARV